MNDILSSSTFFGLFLTLTAYALALEIKKRFRSSLVSPLLLAVIMCIAVLAVFRIDYDTYHQSARYISFLLTPATVCLAIPLAKVFHFSQEEYITFLPKSITTAIGMSVSEEFGGYVAITVTVIILTGIFGNIICEKVLKIFGIRNRIAKGIAIGTASHAIGTAKAMEIGEIEGAMSSLSVVVSGILTVILAGLFVGLY